MTAARLTRASQRLKSYLVAQGYLGAGVVITPGVYNAQANRVPLVFSVITGPRVRVELSGAHISNGAAGESYCRSSRKERWTTICCKRAGETSGITLEAGLLQCGRRGIVARRSRQRAQRSCDLLRGLARGPVSALRGSGSKGTSISTANPGAAAATPNRFVPIEGAVQPAVAARRHRRYPRALRLKRFSQRTSDLSSGRHLPGQEQ